jgi:hypothetical protein
MLYGSGYGCAFVIMQPPLTKRCELDERTSGVKAKTLHGAAVLAVMIPVVITGALAIGAPAGAASETVVAAAKTATTTTVTARDPSVVTGRPVVFFAVVSPSKVGHTKLSGTLSWTLTARNGGHLRCSVSTSVNRGGKAKCKIDKGVLLASETPLTVTARYSGDPNFGPSYGTVVQGATNGVTRVRLVLPVRPMTGAPTLVKAYVKDGPGTNLIVGYVTFVISSAMSSHGPVTTCGGTTPASNKRPIINGVATCYLRRGWVVNPPATGPHSHRRTAWSITATYSGSFSFSPSTSTKSGHADPRS